MLESGSSGPLTKKSGADAVSRLVLDTSAYSHFARGDERVLDYLGKASSIFVPVIVVGELEAAFAMERRAKANLQVLSEFLDEPGVHLAELTRPAARAYGEIVSRLRRAGRPVATSALWIAATTIAVGGELLTFDTDFEDVTELRSIVLKPDTERWRDSR
jgi:tRNA(fMet)-specific endonuclease VapC